MKILRITKLEDSKNLAAYVDIETDDGIAIKGFRLVKGNNGLFLSPPTQKGKDGKYYETVTLPKEIKQKLEKSALDEYNK